MHHFPRRCECITKFAHKDQETRPMPRQSKTIDKFQEDAEQRCENGA